MVAREDPRPLTKRVRRLELLLTALLMSMDGYGDDEGVWFELNRVLRRGRDGDPTDLDIEFLIDRLLRNQRRSQPQSVLRQVDELRSELRVLKDKTGEMQVETHALLAIQALGLPSERVQSIRFVPVRAYIDETPQGAITAISLALSEVLEAYGFNVADEFPEIRGSWFKKWFAKSKDLLSQPEVLQRLEKIERAVEIKAIDRPQAEVDEKQATAMAKLIKALEKVPNAAVQAGSVLVVKLTTPKGSVIQARTLTQDEMVELENNQLLLQDPSEVLGKLSAACSTKRSPPPKGLEASGA